VKKEGAKVAIFAEKNNFCLLNSGFRLHFGIHYDTNRCTDFTDFTDGYGFLEPKCWVLSKKIKKIRTNP
jgi:hypothetical protein